MLTHPTTVPTLLPIYLRRLLTLSPVAAALVPDRVQSRIQHGTKHRTELFFVEGIFVFLIFARFVHSFEVSAYLSVNDRLCH
jgi:hypothetical protein